MSLAQQTAGRPAPTRRGRRLSCIVLDLDETLVWTAPTGREGYERAKRILPPERLYAFYLDDDFYWGVKRPDVSAFIDFCFTTFDIVGVWSAGEKDYVTTIVSILFTRRSPAFVWTRDDTLSHRGDNYKPIDILLSTYPELDPYNTIIVDDRADVAQYSPQYLVEIPKYEPRALKTPDHALRRLMVWIRDVKASGIPFLSADKGEVWR